MKTKPTYEELAKRGIFGMLHMISDSGKRAAKNIQDMLSFVRKTNSKFTIKLPQEKI